MKITYDKKEEEQREIVAFIDKRGDLCIRGRDGESIMFASSGAYESVVDFRKSIERRKAVKTFYRGSGDSVTITF